MESFRPFAPCVLAEDVGEWFEEGDEVPFMTQVFQIREEKRALIPAVTHVDGSGRLQTVHRHANPRYVGLIEAFNALTGVPMVLNTSFNENEPVVCRPREALDCFLRTKMDRLVLGDWRGCRGGETKTVPGTDSQSHSTPEGKPHPSRGDRSRMDNPHPPWRPQRPAVAHLLRRQPQRSHF